MRANSISIKYYQLSENKFEKTKDLLVDAFIEYNILSCDFGKNTVVSEKFSSLGASEQRMIVNDIINILTDIYTTKTIDSRLYQIFHEMYNCNGMSEMDPIWNITDEKVIIRNKDFSRHVVRTLTFSNPISDEMFIDTTLSIMKKIFKEDTDTWRKIVSAIKDKRLN